jgi:hypothetical protein
VYPGTEKATAEEGTFREVEDFFLRPSRIFDRVLSMNETGVTGLINMPTAEIPRPGATFARVGIGYTFHDRFAGANLPDSQAIETFTAPLTYQSVPWRNLELSLQVMGVSEDAENFPLVSDYEVTGIREVGLNAKYRFFENPRNGFQAAFGFGMKVGVERVATRIGSNAVDYSLYLVGTKRMKNFGMHLRGGLTFPNGETRTNSGVPDITQVDLGLDFSPSDRLSITGELGYTDWNFVGTNTEATLGIKYKMSETWALDFGVPLSRRVAPASPRATRELTPRPRSTLGTSHARKESQQQDEPESPGPRRRVRRGPGAGCACRLRVRGQCRHGAGGRPGGPGRRAPGRRGGRARECPADGPGTRGRP